MFFYNPIFLRMVVFSTLFWNSCNITNGHIFGFFKIMGIQKWAYSICPFLQMGIFFSNGHILPNMPKKNTYAVSAEGRVENQKLNQTAALLSFGWVFGFQLGLLEKNVFTLVAVTFTHRCEIKNRIIKVRIIFVIQTFTSLSLVTRSLGKGNCH